MVTRVAVSALLGDKACIYFDFNEVALFGLSMLVRRMRERVVFIILAAAYILLFKLR